MSPKFLLISSVLLPLVSAPLAAQTFPADQSEPYSPGTYRTGAVWGAGNIDFNNTTGTNSDPYSVTPDFKETVVTLSDGSEVSVFDICAEIFIGPTGTSTLTASEGFGPLSALQEGFARALFSNAIDEFILARDTLSMDDPNEVGVAIQIAFWEIVEDSGLSIDEDAGIAGDLSVLGFASGYSGATAGAISLAETYLSNVRTGTWVDEGGYNYYYAVAGSEQDRLWITTGIVPEPSAALLGLFGGLLLLRRRR